MGLNYRFWDFPCSHSTNNDLIEGHALFNQLPIRLRLLRQHNDLDIVIVDDATAGDEFTKSIMSMAVPNGIKLSILGVADGAKLLANIPDGHKIIVFLKVSFSSSEAEIFLWKVLRSFRAPIPPIMISSKVHKQLKDCYKKIVKEVEK
jgi:hypothetical protein